MRCGESGHMARDCPRGQAAAPTGPAGGWKKGLCMRCGESGHMARDCPRGQAAAHTGPAGGGGAAAGPSQRRDTGKGIMKGRVFILA
ncbi:RVT_1 domain-containing protein/zf-CCHC domain-containing protein/rve domain-containing protein/RVP_2 domain-containing protein, partial [Cephalotus follicularis]